MSIDSQIGDILARYWLDENQYCGMTESQLLERLNRLASSPFTGEELRSRLLTMQERGEVAIGNPKTDPIVFPRRSLLEPRDPTDESQVGTYTKQLRLGGSQIEHRYFSRQILDRYRQDPRYEFQEFDVSGRISTPDDSPGMSPQNRVHIRFGQARHRDAVPAVAAILFDLGELPRVQQQYWASFEILQECRPDPGYVKQQFDAEDIARVSPITALLGELAEINRICNLLGQRRLFRDTYEPYELSPRLGSITKPTAGDFDDFVLELDKLLSQNINKAFFEGKTPFKGSDGREKGTLRLLDEYLHSFATGDLSDVVALIVGPLEEVSQRRIQPAHKITKNQFGTDYWTQQRSLIIRVLDAIRLLRKALGRHPGLESKEYVRPEWLEWPTE